ncbi:MAG TPA: terpene cyclase/mutase family protein, partial [Pirellulaceae bacterium]|nr:terpene cyclase/mutase family protein [Pirellulaceae bacterium]
IQRTPDEGELNVPVDPEDEVAFNLPIPDNINLKNKQQREMVVAAHQDARELQIDRDLPTPNMPDLGAIKNLAASNDPIRRSLAVRDPRLRVEVVKKEGGTTLTEAAVSRGLRWLARQQASDGRWTNGNSSYDNANTAMALMPFLGAGQSPTTGMYKDTVSQGLRWLIAQQKDDGDLRGSNAQHPGMYAHGIASIVLCDAFAITGDEQLRGPAQKAVDFICKAQSSSGGWRYFPRQDADLSVVGWQLMALQSARMCGLKVPPETLELADQYLDSVAHDDGAYYSYQRQGSEGRPTPAMTAEGLLCRMYLGWKKDNPGLVRGVETLLENHLPKKNEPSNVYYWYYGTQVFHHYGGEPWRKWNQRMRDLLVESQVLNGPNAGSWNPDGDRWGAAGGRIFMTSLCTCSLEVYYRHAPIYRQIKLD